MKQQHASHDRHVTRYSTQQAVICFACLTFFPLVFFLGKAVMNLL